MTLPKGFGDKKKKEEQVAELLKQGNSLFGLKKYHEAIKCYTDALKIDRTNVSAMSKLGSVYVRLDRCDKAAKYFDEMLMIKDDYLSEDMIASYMLSGQHSKIMEYSNKHLEVDDIISLALNRDSNSFTELHKLPSEIFILAVAKSFSAGVLKKNFSETIQIANGFAALYKEESIARANLALINNSGGYEEVIQFFNTSNPQDEREVDVLVESLESLGRYREIREIYQKENDALAHKPGVKLTDSELVRKGRVLVSIGEFQQAIKCFDEVSAPSEEYYNALTYKGTALSKQGKNEQAIKCFDEVLNERPLRARTLYPKAVCLDRWGKYDEAVSVYDSLLRYFPFRVDILVDKGISLFNLGRFDDAIKSYDEALIYNPRSVKALVGKGQCLNALDRTSEALEEYKKALKINKSYADAWINMAETNRILRRRLEADECFKKSVDCYNTFTKYRGKSVEALTNKGVALFRLERHECAIRVYDEALKMNALYAKAWINKGLALYSLNRHGESIEAYRHCSEIGSEVRLSRILEGITLYRMGKYDEAIYVYDQVINMSSENKDSLAYVLRGEANQGKGKYALALGDFHRISGPRYDYRKHFDMGICHYQLGFFDDAERDYRDAINALPEFVEAYYNLGVLYNTEGKRERAIKAFETAESIDRNFAKAREARSRLLEIEQSDWYDWWFKKGLGKKVLGSLLLAITIALIGATSYLALISATNIDFFGIIPNGATQSSNSTQMENGESSDIVTDTAIILVMVVLLIVVLLLPSLKKVKLGNVELDTQQAQHRKIALEPLFSHIQDESITAVSISPTM